MYNEINKQSVGNSNALFAEPYMIIDLNYKLIFVCKRAFLSLLSPVRTLIRNLLCSGHYVNSDEWLNVFGERLIMQKPEDMELFPKEEKGYSYLMLFWDGVKIDLTLLPLEVLDEYFTWDKLVKLLLDKDNRVTNIPVPTDEDYYIEHPTARSFDDCCNEFWNTVTYVVKGLCRKEILFAIDHLNNIVRMELLRMISWKVGIEQGYSFSLGKNYKFLERYISPELWKKILATYNMGSYTEMWKSLELCMGIFRMVSKEVAQCLNYLYPDYDKNISNYVIRQKEKYQR